MTAYTSNADYQESMARFRQSLAESEKVLGTDSFSGTTGTQSSTLGFIEQPFLQFSIGSKFTIRTPNFDINSRDITSQSRSNYLTTNTYTRVLDFDVTQASKLVSLQTVDFQRLATGQDLGFSKDYRRLTSNNFSSSGYTLVQVEESTKDPLMGSKGRYELSAHESINLHSRTAHFVARSEKTTLLESQTFQARAKGAATISANAAASVSAGAALSLQGGAMASLSAAGLTKVSAIGPVMISGAIVQINMSGGSVAKGIVNLDFVKELKTAAAFLPGTAIALAAGAASGGNFLTTATDALGGVGGTLGKVVTAAQAIATGNYGALTGLVVGELAGPIKEGLTNLGISDSMADSLIKVAGSSGNLNTLKSAIGSEVADVAGRAVSGLVDVPGRSTATSIAGAISQLKSGSAGAAAAAIQELVDDPLKFFGKRSDEEKTTIAQNDPNPPPAEEEVPTEGTGGGEIPPPPTVRPTTAYKGATAPEKSDVLGSGGASVPPAAQESLPDPVVA